MKNLFQILSGLALTIIFSLQVSAGNRQTTLPVLTNYRIPLNQKGAFIGRFVISGNFAKGNIVLQKDTAGLFRIDREGKVYLKSLTRLTAAIPGFCYGITVGFGEKSVEYNLVKDEFIHTPVVAHRGAWKNQPGSENSIGSLKSAIALGCAASEFDVWWSADHVPVICHDPSIRGKVVEKTTAKELHAIDLENDEGVPSLEQYLKTTVLQNKTRLVLEIKSSQISQQRTLELTDAVVRMVHDLKAQAWVDYISFNYGALLRIRELDPTTHIAYLKDDKSIETLASDKISGLDYPFYSFQRDSSLIGKAHKVGLTVNVWTVNDAKELVHYLNEGVDFITTNEPEQLIQLVVEKNK
ncbi:glycerophosphodiester phosphodiesterase family protein [Prolixibacter sp. NT017]|uniref:glycerophosphodiester phosphodiesterase n=1 Tax=Prolixibacter sp. NT017 TaxID=2652390 RepID=UPI00127157F1|nr:glycerophosphodiester phosphodiesterase family protein [Prolixibacter sp. NT017]GET26431.1 hypothetical protein NT017_27600 [Prolixibacter sp. NT017]